MTKTFRKKEERATAQMTDLIATTPGVIAERISRMAASAARPNYASRREAQLMVREKLDASAESMRDVALAAWRINAQFIAMVMRPWLADTRPSTSSAADIAAFMRGAAADLTSSAVKPMLRKVKANARRLAK